MKNPVGGIGYLEGVIRRSFTALTLRLSISLLPRRFEAAAPS